MGKEQRTLRSEHAIRAAYQEFWDKVWYARHRQWVLDVESGDEALSDEQISIYEQARAAARRLEQQYGWENFSCDDGYELGLITGRMSALAWVLGAGWDESCDT